MIPSVSFGLPKTLKHQTLNTFILVRFSEIKVAQQFFHVLYLVLFKWLLTEAIFLGLILDSWVRMYTSQKLQVKYNLKVCGSLFKRKCSQCLRFPCILTNSTRYMCCNTRLCCSNWYDRCCFFEKDDYGRQQMSVTETLKRLHSWKQCDMNVSVKFMNYKLMQMAMQSKLTTDHPQPHHEQQRIKIQKERTRHHSSSPPPTAAASATSAAAAAAARTAMSAKKRSSSNNNRAPLVYEEDVVKMLNSVIVPYYPLSIEHQPHLYTARERAVEVLASKGIRNNLTINSIHTIQYGLDVMTRCQQEGYKQMLKKSTTLYHEAKQLEERLLSLRESAHDLELHAPNVNST